MSDRRPQEQTVEAAQIRRPSRLHALGLYLIAAAGLCACSLLLPSGTSPNLANLLYYLLFFGVPVVLTMRKTGVEAFRPNPVSLRCTLLLVILAVNGVLLANNLTVLWAIPFQKLGFDVSATSVSVPGDARDLVVSVLVTAVLPGVCEEFLFRGAILSGLETGGTKRAMFLTSVLFALLHGSLIGLPAQFLFGMIITYVVVCCDSVYAGAIYHTVHNAATLVMQFLEEKNLPAEEAAVTDYFTAVGGVSGLLMLLIEMLMSAAILFLLLRMFFVRSKLRNVPTVPDRELPLSKSEWAVLLGALVCVAGLYFVDIWLMLGGTP